MTHRKTQQDYMKNLFLVLFTTSTFFISAQEWVQGMYDHNVNFYQVQSQFEEYWKQVEREAIRTNENFRPGKSGLAWGWPQFRRWENFWETRVSGTDGMRPAPGVIAQTMFFAAKTASAQNAGDWQPIGPFSAPNSNSYTGIGRINCIAFHPVNSDTIWVGAPAGGLWKSTNGGQTWSTNTDHLPNLGVSSIAIDPLHPDTMYIATGDRDGGDTFSFGVLKSTDGGQTWSTTGLTQSVQQGKRIGTLHIISNNTQIVIAAARDGIFRSTDGGATWNGVQAGSFNTLAPDAQNPHIVYAGTSGSVGRIYRSKDSGATWTMLTSGLPSSGVNRVEIAISPQDSNYVYALFSANNNGFGGLYRSIDGGDSWTLRSNSPNILGWSATGSGTGGQGWYDLALAVDPTNKNRIYVGGVNVWASNNGGGQWTCIGHWYGQNGVPIVHADIHTFAWQPKSNDLFIGTDGGVYETTNSGNSFIPHKDGMNITQYYKISQSLSNPSLLLGGAQDNGTHRQQGANWDLVRGGDGMDNGIDPDNNQIMYASVYYGDFSKSTNGGNTFFSMNSLTAAGSGNWVTPFLIDPTNSNIIYAGFDQLWRSNNKGNTWNATSANVIGNGNIDAIAVAPSNNQIIYVSIDENLYRSANNGSNWNLVSQGMPGTSHITGITVSNIDANHIWVSRSSYAPNHKVFESTDGGQTWLNRTGNLPNLPVNCIVYQNNSLDAVYIGTDVGVYYRDATLNDWTPYMLGLPNVIVKDLEIYYAGNKIRAGTYGRGIWEASLYSNFFSIPNANFTALPFSTCATGDTVTLTDASQGTPSNWKWSFYPNTVTFVNGTADTSQNPQVVFNALGDYTITLQASNQYGSDTETKPKAVSVGGKPLPFTEDFEGTAFYEQWQVVNPDNSNTWQTATISGTQPGDQAAYMEFYNYTAIGQKDGLITPVLSFDGYTNINLTFDHAYVKYNASKNDTLKVYVSTDCGQNWSLVATFAENGSWNWITGSASTNLFVPLSSSDWCGGALGNASCKTVNLNSYAGNNAVRIKFEAVNDFGNNLYLDNINITGTPTAKPVADFVGDTAGCTIGTFAFYDVSSNSPTSWSWSFPGGTPSTSTAANPQVTYATGGTYAVTLMATNAVGTDTVVKTTYVDVEQAVTPTANVSMSASTICDNETLTLWATHNNAGTNPFFIWYRNGVFEYLGNDTLVLTNVNNGDNFKVVMRPSITCVTNDSILSNTVSVTVIASPTVTLNGFSQVCLNDNAITLSGGQPAGGTYSGNGVSAGAFDPQQAGVGGHIITYTYVDPVTGCVGTATSNITVNNPPPQPSVTYNNFILKADPITTSYTYQWLDGQGNAIPGATDTIFIPTATGDYAVEVTFLNGCKSQSAYYTVTQIGINEFSIANGIGLYPNPADKEIAVQLTSAKPISCTISILDMTGRLLYSQDFDLKVGQQEITLDISSIPVGVYMLDITDGKQHTTKKFTKK